MSDPVTNVEIEDVLSSIRRLVSHGDAARSPDAPVGTQGGAASETAVQSPAGAASDKFVLTPALMVVENTPAFDNPDEVVVEEGTDDGWYRSEPAPNDASGDAGPSVTALVGEADAPSESDFGAQTGSSFEDEGPLELTNLVWEPIEEATEDAGETATSLGADEGTTDDGPQTVPDRSDLVATIAELEAAVGVDTDDFEPDGSEVAAQTIEWPGAAARSSLDTIEDAQVETSLEDGPRTQEQTSNDTTEEPVFAHRSESVAGAEPQDAFERPASEDDDLDGLLEAGGMALDEEALRALVSEVVREELTGPLGERITRNVRKLVRREIHRILNSQDFD